MDNEKECFYIIEINCDCSKQITARRKLPHAAWGGAICPKCHANVGSTGWEKLGRIHASSIPDAVRIFNEKQDKLQNNGHKEAPIQKAISLKGK